MKIQGRYWLLTIREEDFSPTNVYTSLIKTFKGQLEVGAGGFRHWQIFVGTERCSLAKLKNSFPTAHIELTRSEAAEQYVWKEETAVEGTKFEYGSKPLCRNSKKDWIKIKENAQLGLLDEIPEDVFVSK